MKVRLIPDHLDEAWIVIATRELAMESGQVTRFYLSKNFKWEKVEPGMSYSNSPRITPDDIPMLAVFFVELQKVFGFNEKVSMPVQKELEATKDHLNDMRAIVFKQMEIE